MKHGATVQATEGTRRGHGLLEAYLAAIYRIDTHPPTDLRIGCVNAPPAMPAAAAAWAGGVFMTACNPHSRLLRPAANARRMRALIRTLASMNRPWLAGRAIDPAGHWPDEASLWIPGLGPAEGQLLARRFGQNAFVWCDGDGAAHLCRVARSAAVTTRLRPPCFAR